MPTTEPGRSLARRAGAAAYRHARKPTGPTWAPSDHAESVRALEKRQRATVAEDELRALSHAELHHKWALKDNRRLDLLPGAWSAGTLVTGTFGWGAVAAFEWAAAAGTTTGLVVGGAAAGVTGLSGLVLGLRKKLQSPRLFAAAGTASSAWVTTASLTGVGWWQLAALGAGTIAAGVPWWRHNAENRRELLATPVEAPEPPRPVEPAPPSHATEVINRWRINVGGGSGPLPGATLRAVHDTDTGVEAIIELVPGKHTDETVTAAMPRIRSGLGLLRSGEELLVDYPAKLEDGTPLTENEARLQVITSSPVPDLLWMTHARFDPNNPGVAHIGQYRDGRGEAQWRVFDRDGVWSGVIIAGTGGGKSSLFDSLAIAARATGRMNIAFIDPQRGMSSPLLAKNSTITALGEDQIEPALRALESLADHREAYADTHVDPETGEALSAIVPGRQARCIVDDCPCGGVQPNGLLVFIDECDQVFSEYGKRFGRLAKRIRKVGMGFVVASQYSGLEVFGNSDMLRSNLAVANYAAYFSASKTGGDLIPGLKIKPSTLPQRKGYGVITSGDRAVPFQTYFAPRRSKDGDLPAPAWAEDLIRQYTEPPLSPMDREAVRGLLPDPEKASQESRARSLAKLRSLMSGGRTALPRGASEPQDASVLPMPVPGVPPVAGAPPAKLPDLSEIERAVVAVMRDGASRTGDIVAAYGTENDRDRVNRALRSLTRKGWVYKPEGAHGAWLLTGQAKRAAA